MTRRRGLAAAAAVVTLLLIVLLAQGREDPYERPYLDPRGTGPDGTRALVELLEARGAEVRVGGLPRAGDEVTVMLTETVSGGARDDLADWVDRGGRLVVTDPFSSFAEGEPGGTAELTEPLGCEIDALDAIGSVEPALLAELRIPPEGAGCFLDPFGDRAAVTVGPEGAGTVVVLSSPAPLVNENLDRADNAALALTLVLPAAGGRVRILDPNRYLGDEGQGDGTVIGALPRRGQQAATQAIIAFLVIGLVAGRRLGRPVLEALPVPLPASDLVLATGRLLDRNRDPGDAAERIRRRTRRRLGARTGLGPDPAPEDLRALLVGRLGLAPDLVDVALFAPVTDAAGLLAATTALDRLDKEMLP